MQKIISIMIVEDQQLFRECLQAVFAEIEWLKVLDSVGSQEEALQKLEEYRPDIILIDSALTDKSSLNLTKQITREYPQTKVLILGVLEDFKEYVEVSAKGYIDKSASLDDLIKAIDSVAKGGIALSPQLTYTLFSQLSEVARARKRKELIEFMVLTPREMEILQMIAAGLSNKEIANRLCLSLYTIKNHVHQMLEKLQVHDRWKAVEYARKKQWI
jgi:two-component system, NarL family, response regulator DegU